MGLWQNVIFLVVRVSTTANMLQQLLLSGIAAAMNVTSMCSNACIEASVFAATEAQLELLK